MTELQNKSEKKNKDIDAIKIFEEINKLIDDVKRIMKRIERLERKIGIR